MQGVAGTNDVEIALVERQDASDTQSFSDSYNVTGIGDCQHDLIFFLRPTAARRNFTTQDFLCATRKLRIT
jgi:hypothetical protein